MKTYTILIIAGMLISACSSSSNSGNKHDLHVPDQSKVIGEVDNDNDKGSKALSGLFTLTDAEKILGEPSYLADSSIKRQKDQLVYQCAYKANAEDKKRKRTGAIYLLVQRYDQLDSAKKRYSFIKTANEDHGIKILHDLGDEAYFHTDGENFYFVMVRKGFNVFNMKVNKITSHTSLDEFNRVAKDITVKL